MSACNLRTHNKKQTNVGSLLNLSDNFCATHIKIRNSFYLIKLCSLYHKNVIESVRVTKNINFSVLVDASDQCNMLNFQLGVSAMGTALAARSWNIKVIQEFFTVTTLSIYYS